MTFLSGYKTYITAALMILMAVAELTGFAGAIPGADDPMTLIMGGIGLIFARGGAKADVKKLEL
jgi:hypothetical protein